ncbi:MAG: sugar phosphate nucleotidyltransferase [Deltaproteobacteria bacterium]|nr:sugar phosphate nucleotidyltransferase [Deltaproteobacteria bacterium]
MKKDIIAMVLAGGRVDELSVLTMKRPKAALPIWGMYRIIDFALSNLMNSGIDVVGVLSQYKPYSLISHIQNGSHWDFIGRGREIRILSPYKGNLDSDWYKGTADAIYQNLNFIDHYDCEDVLVLSGDHIYAMDYTKVLRFHREKGADLTIVFKQVNPNEAHRFGIGLVDENQRVIKYEEKPKVPISNLASLTIYIFKKNILKKLVIHNAMHGKSFQIYSEIIPYMIENNYKIYGYIFEGYWQYARTIEEYFKTNFDILNKDNITILESMNIRTNPNYLEDSDLPPTFLSTNSLIVNSVVSPGVRIYGEVRNSIISPGTIIEKGALVKNSIIFSFCKISSNSKIINSILDKNVIIGEGSYIGEEVNLKNPPITIIGKNTHIPPYTTIGGKCIIYPDLEDKEFKTKNIPSGTEYRGN